MTGRRRTAHNGASIGSGARPWLAALGRRKGGEEMRTRVAPGRKSDRPLLWAGVLGPLVVTAAVVSESFTHGAVNPWQQSISLLSEGAAGTLLRLSLVLGGVFTMLFAWALHRVWAQAAALFRSQLAMGIGLVVTGLFIQQGLAPPGDFRIPSPWGYLTPVGVVHILGAAVLYLAIVASCWAVARSLPADGRWRRPAWYSGATGLAIAVLLPAFVVAAGVGGPSGLLERLAAVLAVAWELWWAGFLLRRGSPANPSGPMLSQVS